MITIFALVSRKAMAQSINTVAVTVAVVHFALVIAQLALFSFPSSDTLTLAIHILASGRT